MEKRRGKREKNRAEGKVKERAEEKREGDDGVRRKGKK